MNKLIGFIGQGWIGRNYADNYESRGFNIVRYDNKEYSENKDKIKDCDIVFIAVPAATTPEGFDDSILIEVLKLVGDEKIAVIKCTLPIGTTDKLQELYPNINIIHSPEFLTEKTAAHDAANPDRNILGYTKKSFKKCGEVMTILPAAPYEAIIPCKEAEIIKYAGNCWFYVKVLMMNCIYDICTANKLDYEIVKEGIAADKRVGKTHLDVIHQGGRGAGGHCFIKDMAALRMMYEKIEILSDYPRMGIDFLKESEKFNQLLLKTTGKDLDLLSGVYGKEE